MPLSEKDEPRVQPGFIERGPPGAVAQDWLEEGAGADHRPSFYGTLVQLSLTSEAKVSLEEALKAFGTGGLGAALSLLGLLNMLPLPPGSSTILGAPLFLVSWQLARGRTEVSLPDWISRGAVSSRHLRKLLKRVGGPLEFVERHMQPRLTALVDERARPFIGGVCVVLSAILMLPIWGGNLAPAAIMTLFGMGVLQRDGLFVLTAWIGVLAFGTAAWLLFGLAMQHGTVLWDQMVGFIGADK